MNPRYPLSWFIVLILSPFFVRGQYILYPPTNFMVSAGAVVSRYRYYVTAYYMTPGTFVPLRLPGPSDTATVQFPGIMDEGINSLNIRVSGQRLEIDLKGMAPGICFIEAETARGKVLGKVLIR